jgi:hypothetical protein
MALGKMLGKLSTRRYRLGRLTAVRPPLLIVGPHTRARGAPICVRTPRAFVPAAAVTL